MQRTTPAAPGYTSTRRTLRVTSKALPQHSRQNNRALVLQKLFQQGAMSRADLARESGLTRVTVSDLVAGLVTDRIVTELGPRTDSRVGKPATLLDIDADSSHIIALDLSADDRFVGAIVNLRATVLHRDGVPIGGATGESALALVFDLAERLFASATARIIGVGVGSPGIVDDNGIVREAPNLGWSELPLATRLSERLRVPVHVGNDANAAALGVHTFGETSGLSLMVVAIEHGVGAGLIIGGALVTGEQFAAGEIGHVTVDEAGDLCACGRRGCLELAIAAPHLRARLERAGSDGRDAVLNDAGRALGIALSPVISTLNLNEVVLVGPAELIDGPFLTAAVETVRARTLSAVSNGLDMRFIAGGEELVLLGAAVLVLSAELGVS